MLDHLHGAHGVERLGRLRAQVVNGVALGHVQTCASGFGDHRRVQIDADRLDPTVRECRQQLAPATPDVEDPSGAAQHIPIALAGGGQDVLVRPPEAALERDVVERGRHPIGWERRWFDRDRRTGFRQPGSHRAIQVVDPAAQLGEPFRNAREPCAGRDGEGHVLQRPVRVVQRLPRGVQLARRELPLDLDAAVRLVPFRLELSAHGQRFALDLPAQLLGDGAPQRVGQPADDAPGHRPQRALDGSLHTPDAHVGPSRRHWRRVTGRARSGRCRDAGSQPVGGFLIEQAVGHGLPPM